MCTWTFIDTETDGLTHPVHIIEIAAQKFDGLTPTGDTFQIYIDHKINIPAAATSIHGYTANFLAKHGVPPKIAYAKLRDFIGDDLVCSHYLPFDWDRALVPELLRLGEGLIGKRGFCTWLLSRRALPEHPTHRLDYLRSAHQLNCAKAHSAYGDVQSVTDLLTRVIFPRLSKLGYRDLSGIQEFVKVTPLLKCRCLIEGLDYEAELEKLANAKREEKQFRKFIEAVHQGSYPMPALLLNHALLEEHPSIDFNSRVFLFTGKMRWGTRPQAKKMIEQRGGSLSNSSSLTGDVDYLILGEDKDKGWTSLIHGAKLKQAFLKKIQDPSSKLKFIREEDFITALH